MRLSRLSRGDNAPLCRDILINGLLDRSLSSGNRRNGREMANPVERRSTRIFSKQDSFFFFFSPPINLSLEKNGVNGADKEIFYRNRFVNFSEFTFASPLTEERKPPLVLTWSKLSLASFASLRKRSAE